MILLPVVMAFKPSLSAVLFDCDGVLADTEPDGHRVAFNAAFAERGLDAVWDVDVYGKLLETGGGKERMTAYFGGSVKPDVIKELHLRKTELFNELITSGSIPLRPGVLDLVDMALQAEVPVGVCSTSSEQAVSNLVRVLMGDRFDRIRIFAGDIVENKKPAPDVYLLAAREMGLTPGNCVVIEDSSIGLQAAKAAGMKCLITKSSYAHREDFSIADRVVDDLVQGAVTLDTLRSLLL